MLKPEQVPDEVVEAFQRAWADMSTLSTKECLAAALNAWPGMQHGIHIEQAIIIEQEIILPLPTEASDE